jgi:hypothetical protein
MTSVRNIIRFIVAAMGMVQLIAFVVQGMNEYGSLLMAFFFFFIAATNFCKECPIIFFARRAYWRMRSRKIPTQKI